MRRVIISLAGVALLVVGTVLPTRAELKCDKVIDNQNVSATTLYATSSTLALWPHRFFGYQSRCTSSSGTAEYDLEFHTGPVNDANQRKQHSTDLVSGDTTEAWTTPASISPVPMAFGWFIVKGSGSNPYDAYCDVYFCKD